ncbi:unnamed protein product, partial [Scytosiphon promiscuus]
MPLCGVAEAAVEVDAMQVEHGFDGRDGWPGRRDRASVGKQRGRNRCRKQAGT